ncbi:hypothetical protein [Rhodohalobacter sp. 614A]|uniref:hypothetical protein n=1 Tax=Rhodohalobacter sp. 614A TaxID=2908649 RepID=UPI001F33EADF|nr:hypothetical protein [Rhodohalobacter sp. 614A]
MSPDELIGMSIFFGSIVAIIFIFVVGSIIKTWLNKGSTKNLSENKEFLDALREFKENMERRMSNLEEIVSDERSVTASGNQERKSQRTIELEFEDEPQPEKKIEETAKLRNILNQ